MTHPSIYVLALHFSAPRHKAKDFLLPDFYSGATGLSGRFREGFLLRRLPRPQRITNRAKRESQIARKRDQNRAFPQIRLFDYGQSSSHISSSAILHGRRDNLARGTSRMAVDPAIDRGIGQSSR
jgi:hypothetical protein